MPSWSSAVPGAHLHLRCSDPTDQKPPILGTPSTYPIDSGWPNNRAFFYRVVAGPKGPAYRILGTLCRRVLQGAPPNVKTYSERGWVAGNTQKKNRGEPGARRGFVIIEGSVSVEFRWAHRAVDALVKYVIDRKAVAHPAGEVIPKVGELAADQRLGVGL